MRTLLLILLVSSTGFARKTVQAGEIDAQLLRGASPRQSCQWNLLKELGWRAERSTKTGFSISPQLACHSDSFVIENPSGLILKISEKTSPLELSRLQSEFEKLLTSKETFCGYKHLVSKAAVLAAEKLVANPDFDFKTLQWGFIQFGTTRDFPKQAWKNTWIPRKLRYVPKSPPSRAIEQFYFGRVRSECAVGLQAAEMAMTYELFGALGFDRSFSSREFTMGTYASINDDEQIFHGEDLEDRNVIDQEGKFLPAKGVTGLIGYSGYLENVYGEDFLDNKANRGENFLILRASEAAAQAIARAGSFSEMNDLMKQVQKLVEQSENPKREAKEIYADRFSTMPNENKSHVHTEVDRLLSRPEFTDLLLFVQSSRHNEKIRELRYHVKRLLKLNPRTPYKIRLYRSPIDTQIFQRFTAERMDSCLVSR
ncbi:MAG: hypothetical protein H7301_06570 [Cryobacterium sp.]|nr:hypothetical protein [Oligoflexia bacterium]